jgi:hypothetical protein
MKKLFLLAIVLLVAASVNDSYAQEKTSLSGGKTAPRTEYSVSLSENVVKLKPGETKQLTVSVLKSKGYSRSATKLGLSSSLPAGVTVAYEPAEGMFESSVASFTAAADSKAGEYQVILKTTVNNKIKGSIVKVVVENGVANALSSN